MSLARRQHIEFIKTATGGLIECLPRQDPGEPDGGEPARTVWEPAQLRIVSRQRARKLRRNGAAVHPCKELTAAGKRRHYWFALIVPPAESAEDLS